MATIAGIRFKGIIQPPVIGLSGALKRRECIRLENLELHRFKQ